MQFTATIIYTICKVNSTIVSIGVSFIKGNNMGFGRENNVDFGNNNNMGSIRKVDIIFVDMGFGSNNDISFTIKISESSNLRDVIACLDTLLATAINQTSF